MKKTSEEWNKDPELSNVLILDPDGWDRSNFQYSWYEEKISKEEFIGKRSKSTVQIMSDT